MLYPEGLSLYTIWEEIVHLLDSTKDLLSLALTCHVFKELIIPDHLHYRHLFIDIRRKGVWEFLERRPRLAKSVRSIKLSNQSTGRLRLSPALSGLSVEIPSNVPVSDTDIAIFKSAISNMPLLKEFTWDRFGQGSPEQLVDISHALTTSVPYLEGLDVDLSDLTIVMCGQEMKRLSIWTLTSLKRVILRTQFPSPDAIQMILSCPNIEDLYSHATSSFMHIFPFYLMQQANWTKLRRLDLQSISPPEEQESDIDVSTIITSFLNRHSNIECLSLYVSSKISLSTLPPSSLPKLRSLSSHLNVVTSLLSQSAISRLVHLRCTVAQIDVNTFPHMDKLESLWLSGNGSAPDVVHPFLSKSPNLKKICLALKKPSEPQIPNLNNTRLAIGETSTVDFPGNKITPDDEHAELFLKYPKSKLTHIYLVSPRSIADDAVKVQTGHLCERLSALRALRYLEVALGYIELERDENGTYSGYHFISFKKAGIPSSWGGLFFNLSH